MPDLRGLRGGVWNACGFAAGTGERPVCVVSVVGIVADFGVVGSKLGTDETLGRCSIGETC